jgi:hypothetical protein
MDPLRLNWDSPLIISSHDSNRLYFAAQYVFRSDDRGNSWKPVSGDLTRRIDRNKLPVMGRVWPIDAVAKNNSTSFYGSIVFALRSPRRRICTPARTMDSSGERRRRRELEKGQRVESCRSRTSRTCTCRRTT